MRCPVLVIHGDEDAIIPVSVGEALAEATGAQLVSAARLRPLPTGARPGAGQPPDRDFLTAPTGAARESRQPRALFVSSPIGLGHARRDLAIARELRRSDPSSRSTGSRSIR